MFRIPKSSVPNFISHSTLLQSLRSSRCVPKTLTFTRGQSTVIPKSKPKKTASLIINTACLILVGVSAYAYGKRKVTQPASSLSSTTPLSSLSPPAYCNDDELIQAIQEITSVIGKAKVVNTKVELDFHTRNDFTPHEPLEHERPKFILYPTSTEEVSEILKVLYKYNVPVVPFSGGTSLEGHFYSTRQGVILNTSKMNRIIEINHDDMDAKVEAGVNWQDLNEVLKPSGLMLGTDCGPNGLISGMINTNASGINASRYGAMITNVISVTVVLADGTIVKTKRRPRKSSAGYNLTGLFVGSEGTLGIVTEATVKLHPLPKVERVVVCQFPEMIDSTNTVAQIFRSGIQPNAVELMDSDMMLCLNYSGFLSRRWLECPTIFFKLGAVSENIVDEYIQQVNRIAKKNNCLNFIFATTEEEGEELFSARKNAFYAMIQYGKNEIDEDVRIWVTDIAVPLSKLPSVLGQVHKLIKSSGFHSVILAHAADGNFHADLYYKIEDKAKCEEVVKQMVKLGLDNEGTCTGEHGVGNAKRKFLMEELGEDAIDLMRKLKISLDPKRILNPDKIFKIDPDDQGEY
ncbi:FAD-binding domain-containing protein [Suhomyces tanzawaensis NRRL Y-17324]|uniref:D-lactate dehydrogenase (cytochrome) n=1 Tax=Suhomyces tanzawaensis NRRL Y-17324 TaxID=984487 RepID=A0A1E4SK19_9ASCO|nr:FAD-binding domain-containing protein [Suhomyces tanzawaensis NRRL Y-17324]ODV79851.1 FAD-binding domain-containing protein [Suhomyces tanzawaensis NRRL Y-17324]